MFTWICPQCGREVPPSETECPNCAGQPKVQEPQAPASAKPSAATPASPSARRPSSISTWLMSIIFALAFVGLFAGGYLAYEHFRKPGAASAQGSPSENPGAAGQSGSSNQLLKYIELGGVRFVQGAKKKTEVRFLVVNHSEAEISDLAGQVNVRGRTRTRQEEPVGSFSFKIPALGPYESKELTVPLNTKLQIYELPDWQNVDSELLLTSPQ